MFEQIKTFFAPFMTFMTPYWSTIGVFIFVYFILGMFEDLIGFRGIWKWLVSILAAVLFFHFWDNVAVHFSGYLQALGLTPVTPGKFK